MLTRIHFIGTSESITLDPQDNERFTTDYESFLSTGKQDNHSYRINNRVGNAYIYLPAIAYIVTDVPQQESRKMAVADASEL